MKTVLTFGTFDTVHPGHEYYLRKAKSFGDKLITIIATDENVLKFKGKYPIYYENKRKEDIEKLYISDEVVIGNGKNPFIRIELYSPKVICLGYDQKGFSETLEKYITDNNLYIKIKRIKPFKKDIYKSSIIKAKSLQYYELVTQT